MTIILTIIWTTIINHLIKMRKTLTILLVLVGLFVTACDGKQSIHGIADTEQDEWVHDGDSFVGEEVYVCTGGSSKKYHRTPHCKGLENCKSDIKKVDQQFAEQKGRTPCKKCYKY